MNLESLNTSLVENLATAVIVLDEELRLACMNPAAEAALETSAKSSRHAYIGDLLLNSAKVVRALRKVQANGSTFIARKAQLTTVNGNDFMADYSISALSEGGEAFLIMEIQMLDLPYHLSRKETLIANHEATLELVRGLSHEIKNPLGGIRGAAQLLAAELEDKALQDHTRIIIEETDRLVNLVDRLTGSRQRPALRPLNIHEVLERVHSLMKAETQGAIELARDYDPSIPEIAGDGEQLIQAVLNVVRNAMQALTDPPLQGRAPRVILRTRAVNHVNIGAVPHRMVARIEIIDNGPGIAEDLIDNIFYPLISGRAEGAGLGLSIAQTVLKNHHGLIECESQEGLTRFIMSIPLTAGEEAHAE